MPRLEDWLEKAKKTKLRYWLNLSELDKLLAEQPKAKLYLVLQTHAALKPINVRVEAVKERIEAEPDGGGPKVLKNLILSCSLISKDEEDQPIEVNAAFFVPDMNNELGTLSRIFTTAIRRDDFLEDLLFCIDVQNDAAAEQQRRMQNRFFKRFFGGGPAESDA